MFKPTKLRTVHSANGMINFYWAAESSYKNCIQEAYHIIIKETDYGWRNTSEQTCTEAIDAFAGENIKWNIQIRDNLGNISEVSESQFLYCHSSEFPSEWIAASQDEENKPVYFRKDFLLTEKPRRAFVFSSGIGFHELHLNGKKIGDSVMSPNISCYPERCYYTVTEITGLLKEQNCFGVIVGEGWRRNNGAYLGNGGVKNVKFFGEPCLNAYIKIFYKNRIEYICTGADWTWGRGAITESNLFNGEKYDARLESEWDKYDGAYNFTPVKILKNVTKAMCYAALPAVKEQHTYKPRSIMHSADGGYIVDFGQNIQGYVRIELNEEIPSGTQIVIKHAEELDEDDSLYMLPLRGAEACDRIIADGNRLSWSPSFTYHGFRYISIEGWQGILSKESVSAILIHSDIESESNFESGSALLNAIHNNIVATEKNNLIGIATDCPQRDERMGWMNDATVRFTETPYNFDVSALFPKIVRDIIDEQGNDGAITCTAPFVYGNRPADPVCSSFLVAAYRNWLHNGDSSLIKEAYPAFAGWNDYLGLRSTDGIVEYSYYGDWAGPEYACKDGTPCSKATPGIFMSTGYRYYNSRLLALFAGILGNNEEKAKREAEAEYVREAFLKKWFDEKECIVAEGSQGAYAFALWLGILPEASRKKAAEKLNAAVIASDYKITTGNLTTVYMLEELCEYGYTDTAYRIFTSEEYPGYGYMIQNCATTIWERFELKKDPGMNSHDHPMYGSVGSWLYSHIAGIKPLDGGFSKVSVKPFIPEKLLYASANVETPKGDIYVKWHKKYGKTYLSVDIPFGVTADISFADINKTVGSGFYIFEK